MPCKHLQKASILSKYILPKKVYMQLNFVLTEKYIEKKYQFTN